MNSLAKIQRARKAQVDLNHILDLEAVSIYNVSNPNSQSFQAFRSLQPPPFGFQANNPGHTHDHSCPRCGHHRGTSSQSIKCINGSLIYCSTRVDMFRMKNTPSE